MLEAQPLDRVGELDVDAEIVGVELELVPRAERRMLVDRHRQRRNPEPSAGSSSFQCRYREGCVSNPIGSMHDQL